MIVSLLVAMDEKRGIGYRGRVPWRLPDDLKHFKKLTMGHHLVMGRKTFTSIGRPLPGRTNIVITRNLNFRPEGCLIDSSLESALEMARGREETEAFVIGGGEIFALALPLADRIYLTLVHTATAADAHFPELSPEDWIETFAADHPADEMHLYPFTLKTLERRKH